jgi:hypothetical protein
MDLGVVRDATFSASLFVKVDWTKDQFLKISIGKSQIARKTTGLSSHSPVCPLAVLNENEKREVHSLA